MNYAKCVNVLNLHVVIGPLQYSSLRIFYANSFPHMCILLMSYIVHQCADESIREKKKKKGHCYSKISNLFRCNGIMVPYDMERIPSNDNN